RLVAHSRPRPGDHRDGRRPDDARAAHQCGGPGMSPRVARQTGPAPVLDLAGLRVSFPGVGTVLDGVDLRLEPGMCLAVVGESGAGKSVLARSLVGLAGEGGAPARVS